MTGESVFLTGATGTVGSGILEILANAGYQVFCLVRRTEDIPEINRAGGHAVVGDMTDPNVFQDLSRHPGFTYIIHAAQAHYRNHSVSEISRQERKAVQNLEMLRCAVTRLMVFTCGVWTYGKCDGDSPINEATPTAPRRAAMDRSLLMKELAARENTAWAQFCLPSFVYGSKGPLLEISAHFIRGDVTISDDESIQWSVIERLDLGRAYHALLRHGRPSDYFLAAEDTAVKVVAAYAAIAQHLQRGRLILQKKPVQSLSDAEDDEISPNAHHRVDSTNFKRRTGWLPQESFMTSFGKFLPFSSA